MSRFFCSLIGRIYTHLVRRARLDISEPAIIHKNQSAGPEYSQSNEHTDTPLLSGCRLYGG